MEKECYTLKITAPIYSYPHLQIYLQNTLKKNKLLNIMCHASANEFAVTGANEFANTWQLNSQHKPTKKTARRVNRQAVFLN
jgi:hypothetical protein